MIKHSGKATTSLIVFAAAAISLAASATAQAQDAKYTIGIVEQQLANPFFSRLQQAGVARAKELGLEVMTAESKVAGDSASQINAIENMINRGVKGIVLDPANAFALAPIVKTARDAGIIVVTTNTSLDPADAANASYETDNLAAGDLIGKWARAQLAGKEAHVAMLDYDLSDKTAGARHNGFMQGFGLKDGSAELSGTALTKANVETGQSSMENLLSAHGDINVLYTINEPAAQGAALAIQQAGATVIVTSIDGSCSGVRSVASGEIGATVMQFPTKMGELAVDAINAAVTNGKTPSGVNNSGTILITDKPVDGIESQTSEWGLKNCWGE
ncbi:substrate-binding domain-containing protein [Rhizobium sp. BE258]|uniref:substrate-binding domain-containing protein n=1 Tax=Rhizobium sp. BE258 TaxID=2817722 RepID=UPI0028559444|nr:substrate-binding domain-containing protein [Rhizobium sp. BE258]MDR7145191.1 fructose transport system substrate-binding protein [Rhizobium sp. BE258]